MLDLLPIYLVVASVGRSRRRPNLLPYPQDQVTVGMVGPVGMVGTAEAAITPLLGI